MVINTVYPYSRVYTGRAGIGATMAAANICPEAAYALSLTMEEPPFINAPDTDHARRQAM